MSTNINEKDITQVMKILSGIPAKDESKGWEFSKTKKHIHKYHKELHFHGDSDLSHAQETSYDSNDATQSIGGTLLKGTVRAPVEFVTNVLLSPIFRENNDPRVEKVIRLHRDTPEYSAIEYYHWVSYGSGIIPTDDNHTIMRTALVKVESSFVEKEHMEKLKPIMMDELHDDYDHNLLNEAVEEKSFEKFNPLFDKVFGNCYVILQTSLVSEETNEIYGKINQGRLKSSKTKLCEVYPNSGFVVRAIGSSRSEIYSILFSDHHVMAKFLGKGVYDSVDPLLSMSDILETEYQKIKDTEWKNDMQQLKYFNGETDEVGPNLEPAPALKPEPVVAETKAEEITESSQAETGNLPETHAAEQA